MRYLLQGEREGERLRGGDDEQHQSGPRRGLHETMHSRLEPELTEREATDQDGISYCKGGDLGRGGEAGLEAGKDHEDQAERRDRAAPEAGHRELWFEIRNRC